MSVRVARVLIASAACALWLAGCGSAKLGSIANPENPEQTASADGTTPAFPEVASAGADPAPTGSVSQPGEEATGTAPGLLGSNPNDDLNLGKRHFRETNFGLAEQHFRKAVELHPRDGEAWLGLAASYDRLRRFDFADRAYQQAIAIIGPRAEVLNNQGYSYMLRGDYRRAREKLMAARAKDPNNAHVKANLQLLEESFRKGKAIQ